MNRETIDKIREEQDTDVQVPLIVFRLGAEEYGIKIEQVKEVTITPSVTRMPKTPAFIHGVANIRGDIIAIMDLEERFQIASLPQTPLKKTYTLVVEREHYNIGLIVKEVPQTLTLSDFQIDRNPAILQDTRVNERYIEGIGKLDNRLIILLDINKIFSPDEEKQLLHS